MRTLTSRHPILLSLVLAVTFLTACILPDERTTTFGSSSAQTPCYNCGAILEGRVTQVLDGDTIGIRDRNNTTFRVRLQGMDAPEKTQAYGPEARQLLTKLTLNHDVEIIWNAKDSYGRIIGKVTIVRSCPSCPRYKLANQDGTCSAGDCEKDVCLQMISEGLAWHFKKYEQSQSLEDRELYNATEKSVRQQQKGLWADPNRQPPWDYRQQQR